MTLSISLSKAVFIATDAERRDIFASEVAVTAVTLDYVAGAIDVACTLPERSDVLFTRRLNGDGILSNTSTAALVAAIAADVESGFPTGPA
jgi:phosphotransferase system IIA component